MSTPKDNVLFFMFDGEKNDYVRNLRQNCWLHNNNRINGNKIVLSISA